MNTSIISYEGIKAYISAFVLSCPEIPDGSLIWGEEKRMLDKQTSVIVSPYFWVTDYRKVYRAYEGNAQIYAGWEIAIEIKGANKIDDQAGQERTLLKCESIVDSLLRYLSAAHTRSEIIFNLNNTSIIDQENYEVEAHWGWMLNITLLVPVNCYKYQPATGSYTVYACKPVWNESGNLTITVNGTEISAPWTKEENRSLALAKLVQVAKAEGLPNYLFSDMLTLYIKAESIGVNTVTLDLTTNNDHAWSRPVTITGADAN